MATSRSPTPPYYVFHLCISFRSAPSRSAPVCPFPMSHDMTAQPGHEALLRRSPVQLVQPVQMERSRSTVTSLMDPCSKDSGCHAEHRKQTSLVTVRPRPMEIIIIIGTASAASANADQSTIALVCRCFTGSAHRRRHGPICSKAARFPCIPALSQQASLSRPLLTTTANP